MRSLWICTHWQNIVTTEILGEELISDRIVIGILDRVEASDGCHHHSGKKQSQ